MTAITLGDINAVTVYAAAVIDPIIDILTLTLALALPLALNP